MKLALIFLLLSVANLWSADRLPQIVCRDARGTAYPLKLERFAMEVEMFADLAETTFTLTFRNETNRQLEGDFLLPLPPKAHISGYALEVNGQFREAVAVEKERAKLAYETIKRRGIDPGIVEKEADNLFRTRIFPIERNSTKSVRLSYLEYLPITGPPPFRPTYRFPINLTSPVGQISILIKRPEGATINCGNLEFLKSGSDTVEAILKNTTLIEELTIESAIPHRPTALASNESRSNLTYLTFNKKSVPDWGGTAEKPTGPQWPAPKKVKLFWDASRSMAGTDFGQTYRYLDAFFTEFKTVEVQLHLFRNTESKVNKFQIVNGDWSKLRKDLENIEYDGSSSFPDLESRYQDLTLLVTDGQITDWPPHASSVSLGRPLVVITTRNASSPVLKALTSRSGGRIISLAETKPEEALRRTLLKSFHIWTTQERVELIPLPSRTPFVYRYLAKGHKLDLERLRIAGGPQVNRQLELEQYKAPKELLQRLAAIATLKLLENRNANASEIIAHCKEHTLVSDYTSLIVLERFEDHLTFEIPPPEPELLARYQTELGKKKQNRSYYLTELWAEALRRHRRQYPGVEVILHPALKRIRTLNQAQAKVFKPDQLDATVSQAFKSWEQQAYQLIEKLQEEQPDETLIKEIVALRDKAKSLGELKAKPKNALAVSVRGHVRKPDTYQFEKATTLTTAMERAQPLNRDYRARVALYRSGQKTVFNTLSKEFVDFPLLPGDMVVLEDRMFENYWGDSDGFSADPFSSDLSADEDYEAEPAVLSEPTPTEQAPATPQDISSLRTLEAGPPIRRSSQAKAPTQTTEMNPVPIALRSLALFQNGKEEEARRHLSNLRELFPRRTTAMRLEGFVLAQWKQSPEKIYRELLQLNPEDHLTTHLLAHFYLANDRTQRAKTVYQNYFEALERRTSFRPALTLLSDRNRLIENVSGAANLASLPKDLRIVVTNLHPDPSFTLVVTDPTGCVTGKNQVSPTGVALTGGVGLWEITDREVIAGSYALKASCERDQLLEIVVYRDYAGEAEEMTRKFLTLEATPRTESKLLEMVVFE